MVYESRSNDETAAWQQQQRQNRKKSPTAIATNGRFCPTAIVVLCPRTIRPLLFLGSRATIHPLDNEGGGPSSRLVFFPWRHLTGRRGRRSQLETNLLVPGLYQTMNHTKSATVSHCVFFFFFCSLLHATARLVDGAQDMLVVSLDPTRCALCQFTTCAYHMRDPR